MRVAVMGAGGVGGYLGARLATAGTDVRAPVGTPLRRRGIITVRSFPRLPSCAMMRWATSSGLPGVIHQTGASDDAPAQ
jgi:ketopantoate reductase